MTFEIGLVLAVLVVTIILFVSEWLRVDVIALCVMVALGWLGLVTPKEAFSGLASNAVLSMIGVMILGYGVDRSGVMKKLTRPVLKVAGTNERRLTGIVSSSVGLMSGFMQNIGATVLFLPAMLRISKKTKIPSSRLLMPMGFAAILGGTLTLVGSGPLIILNDLLKSADEEPFGLFSVTPVGLALLVAGILYFYTFGARLLPGTKSKNNAEKEEEKEEEQKEKEEEKEKEKEHESFQQEIIDTWDLPQTLFFAKVESGSEVVDQDPEGLEIWSRYRLNLLALSESSEKDEEPVLAPWRHTRLQPGMYLALLGYRSDFETFVEDKGLTLQDDAPPAFQRLLSEETAGFAEAIVPPRSPVVGKSLREISLRKTYGVEPIMLLSGDKKQRGDFSDEPLSPGDTIVVHGCWKSMVGFTEERTFVLTARPRRERDKGGHPLVALSCFLGAIVLALTGFPLSLSLLTGAVAMVLLRVIQIDEAYDAVEWRTVFLLAGLIPLGVAMDKTGAARFISLKLMQVLQGSHPLVLLTAVGLLSTLFTLFMSNVAATVLLVPLVMIMGKVSGLSPRGLAMLVAICASNSFLLPTHQVNALLMSPGGYRNADYLRAGGGMSLLFLVVAVGLSYVLYF